MLRTILQASKVPHGPVAGPWANFLEFESSEGAKLAKPPARVTKG